MKKYYQKLFEGPAGAIYLAMTKILDTFVHPTSQATINSAGQLSSNSKFSWCDHLTMKDTDEVLKTTLDIDAGKAASSTTLRK